MGFASGASLVNSCGLERQSEKIIPYLVPPDDGVIPGQATYTSTTCTECPAGCGLSAKTVDYQIGKLEGATGNPINDGSLCMRGQASLSRLRHPDRLKQPMRKNEDGAFYDISWDDAYAMITDAMRSSGKSVYLSSRTTGSLSQLIADFCAATGTQRLPEFEMFSYSTLREANRIVFDRGEIPSYRIDEADFLLTVGADILETFVSPVSYASQFGRAKRAAGFEWHHVEPHVSLTGMQAKHRFVITPGSEPYLLAFLLRKVSRANLAGDRHIAGMVESLPTLPGRGYAEKTGISVSDLDEMAEHLLSAKKPLVISGGVSTMNAHGLETAVLTALLQWATGMIGSTVDFLAAEDYTNVGDMRDLQSLSQRLDDGRIGVLFMSKIDLLGTVPDALGFDDKLGKASLRVGLGEVATDTMQACDLVLPLSNALESWGDVTARRGMIAVIQPVVEPPFDTKTEGDILLAMSQLWNGENPVGTYQEYLFGRWTSRFGERGVEKLLVEGFLETGPDSVTVELNRSTVENTLRSMKLADSSVKPALVIAPSLRFYDGRSRALPLMSEIPDPLTTISWGGWLSISEESARELGVEEEGEVAISSNGWSAELPVKIQQGMPRGVMTAQFGAINPAPVGIDERTGDLISTFGGVGIQKTGKTIALPILAGSQSQEGRGVIPRPHHDERHHHDPEATLYPDKIHPDYRWGMVIDLDLCTGCSACASACYVENNVAVVGAERHLKGREMSWIHIEPFYDHGDVELQPMLCQHCTNAPCESVCPVIATYHNPEGLNAQVYNRCVGTRYCANNCPYKVRRFNWFDFRRPGEMNMTRNPEVSPRGAGVMEKCTFCVQRIRAGRDVAKDEGRKIGDGEVTPACAQTCPTQSITCGNLQDENSEVHKHSKSERVHRVFEQLGTDPAVYYLRNKWKNGHG
jgi:molybdopterin-containing oxidoreductase family iron-sulfur binding subunit